jgi:nonribosomal peptide synthetase DhbF
MLKSVDPFSNLAGGFRAAVRVHAARIALDMGGRTLDYAALDAHSEALARRLTSRLTAAGARPGAPVGLAWRGDIDGIVAMIALARAGAAFVPLDPGAPAERLRRMALEAGIGHVLGALPALAGSGLAMLDPDMPESAPESVLPEPDADSAACVTWAPDLPGPDGAPAAVLLPHRAVLRLIGVRDMLIPEAGIPQARVLHHAPAGSGALLLEVWGTLLHGGTLVLAAGESPAG